MEHGHALLIRALEERRPEWLTRTDVRVLEVGTTREALPGQDSTRILAQYCLEHGWDFVTCDMDPKNTERAQKLFADLGASFTAVTAKGEDYVASQRKAFDAVYLDAYDFEHRWHSDERQQRYEELLGSKINQRECEVMHLKAMQGLNRAGRRGCVVVIDDTWRESPEGRWLGKGPMAVPWALRNGWSLTLEPPGFQSIALELDPNHYAPQRRLLRAARRMRRRARRALGVARPASAKR